MSGWVWRKRATSDADKMYERCTTTAPGIHTGLTKIHRGSYKAILLGHRSACAIVAARTYVVAVGKKIDGPSFRFFVREAPKKLFAGGPWRPKSRNRAIGIMSDAIIGRAFTIPINKRTAKRDCSGGSDEMRHIHGLYACAVTADQGF